MGKRDNFTVERVAGFKCQDGKAQTIFWDGKIPGLGLRVTATGAKAYIFETRLHGKTLRTTIGSPDAWPLETQWRVNKETGEKVEHQRGARQEAARLKSLTDQGIDPRQLAADKAAAAEAHRAELVRRDLTFGTAWKAYVAARSHKWGDLYKRDHERAVKPGGLPRGKGRREGQGDVTYSGLLYPLLDERLANIDAKRLELWLDDANMRGKTEAAKTFRMLRACLNWCAERQDYQGLISADAHANRDVRDLLQKPKAKKLVLQREQLQLWFESVRSIGNPFSAAYLQGLLITGARRNELGELKWDDVDFQWNSLSIKDKVAGRRIIPLTPFLAGLLRDLKRINETPPNVRKLNELQSAGKPWQPSQWVFKSETSASGRLADPLRPLQKAMQASGLPIFSPHDLRRSFATLSEWSEVPAGVVAQIMGHSASAIAEKHYIERPLDLLRMWHIRIESWMLEQAGIEQPKPTSNPELKVVAS
ncbi:MAG: DUF4102 domain-containing protein [Rhodocyclales bacterium GT-UBC]|nr:MAG: DUF4102 domain-containing protein [Rhodocyclales bacterium GT-UBC]